MASKRPLITLSVLGGIIIILIIVGRGPFSSVSGFVRTLVKPFASFVHRSGEGVGSLVGNRQDTEDLKRQNEELKIENENLLAEKSRLLTLEDENSRLRDYLSFAQSQKRSLQMAEIIARGVPEDSWRNRETVTLNQGTDNGINVGLPIVSSEGVLVGKITSVKNNISEACLLYNPDCRLAVTVAGQGATLGVARGDLGLTVLIELIPQNREIKEGDLIVTSGVEGNMPAGLLIGKVNRVIKESNELWQQAIVDPSANIDDLRFVAILK